MATWIARLGRVSENAALGTAVMQLSPLDEDAAPNAGPFRYRLLPSPHSAAFAVHPSTNI